MDMQDEKLGKFIEAINKDAEERRARILAESEEYNKAEMEKAEIEALSEAYHLIQEEAAQMRANIRRDISSSEIKLHRDVLIAREKITQRVFDEAANRMIAFTKSDAYRDFLLKTVTEAKPVFSKKACVVYLRPDDMQYAGLLSETLGENAQVIEDDSIILGGLRIKCSTIGLTADETLDTRLENQKIWFAEHSGLSIL